MGGGDDDMGFGSFMNAGGAAGGRGRGRGAGAGAGPQGFNFGGMGGMPGFQ